MPGRPAATDAARLAEAASLGYHVLVGDASEEHHEAHIASAKVVAVVLPAAAGANRIARMITHPSAVCLLWDERGMAQLNEQLLEIGLQRVVSWPPATPPNAFGRSGG